MRRLLPLLALLALLVAPLGRVAATEAMLPHLAAPAAGAHCPDMPQPDGDDADTAKIDCLVACAIVLTAAGPMFGEPTSAPLPVVTATPDSLVGISPEADPPPPRVS